MSLEDLISNFRSKRSKVYVHTVKNFQVIELNPKVSPKLGELHEIEFIDVMFMDQKCCMLKIENVN